MSPCTWFPRMQAFSPVLRVTSLLPNSIWKLTQDYFKGQRSLLLDPTTAFEISPGRTGTRAWNIRSQPVWRARLHHLGTLSPTLLGHGQPCKESALLSQSLNLGLWAQWFPCSLLHLVSLPLGLPPESHPPFALLGSIGSIYILSFNRKDRPSFASWLPRAIRRLCNTHNVQRQQSQDHLNYLMK